MNRFSLPLQSPLILTPLMYPPRSIPESCFQYAYQIGWGLAFFIMIGGALMLKHFYKEAIKPIVSSRDVEKEGAAVDEEDNKKQQGTIAEFYLKKRCMKYLGVINNTKKKIPETGKKSKTKKNSKEKVESYEKISKKA